MQVVIGEIAKKPITVRPEIKGECVYTIFNDQRAIETIVVEEDSKPVGLLMKDKFFQHLSTRYGYALFMERPVELMMDKSMLVVDYYAPLTNVSTVAMKRERERVYDCVVVKKGEELYGVVSIQELIMKLSEEQVNTAKYSNPLSGLPGNMMINNKLEAIIKNGAYSVLYLDLDHFKPFNDVYGFNEGDKLLIETANIIKECVGIKENHFVGHIGGDDFIAVLPHHQHEFTCEMIIKAFQEAVIRFYSKEDLDRGYVKTIGRKGVIENIPLVSISIAVIQNKNVSSPTLEALSREAANIKQLCKSYEGSIYMSNHGATSVENFR